MKQGKVKRELPSPRAIPPGYTRGKLYSLWRDARRRHPQAQAELLRVLRVHPSASAWLKWFAAEWDEMRGQREKVLGVKQVKPQGAWERNAEHAREGGRWVGIVRGGLPSLGKRRP